MTWKWVLNQKSLITNKNASRLLEGVRIFFLVNKPIGVNANVWISNINDLWCPARRGGKSLVDRIQSSKCFFEEEKMINFQASLETPT